MNMQQIRDRALIQAGANHELIEAHQKLKSRKVDPLIIQLVMRRHQAGLTQKQVAFGMNTTASAVARFESGGGRRQHSPSLKTCRLYAATVDSSIQTGLLPLIV